MEETTDTKNVYTCICHKDLPHGMPLQLVSQPILNRHKFIEWLLYYLIGMLLTAHSIWNYMIYSTCICPLVYKHTIYGFIKQRCMIKEWILRSGGVFWNSDKRVRLDIISSTRPEPDITRREMAHWVVNQCSWRHHLIVRRTKSNQVPLFLTPIWVTCINTF